MNNYPNKSNYKTKTNNKATLVLNQSWILKFQKKKKLNISILWNNCTFIYLKIETKSEYFLFEK